jgi:quercetin dioxygenase-like cupin family protein
MEFTRFDEAAVEEPGEGWRRAGLLGSEALSVDWFEKPPGHVSERHSHEHEQVFVVLRGTLVLHIDDESVTLRPRDAARVEPWEDHYTENPTEESCTGLNAFAPEREFPYWTD